MEDILAEAALAAQIELQDVREQLAFKHARAAACSSFSLFPHANTLLTPPPPFLPLLHPPPPQMREDTALQLRLLQAKAASAAGEACRLRGISRARAQSFAEGAADDDEDGYRGGGSYEGIQEEHEAADVPEAGGPQPPPPSMKMAAAGAAGVSGVSGVSGVAGVAGVAGDGEAARLFEGIESESSTGEEGSFYPVRASRRPRAVSIEEVRATEQQAREAEEAAERVAESLAAAAAELEEAEEEDEPAMLQHEMDRCALALRALGARLRGIDDPEARLLYATLLTTRAKLTHAKQRPQRGLEPWGRGRDAAASI